MQLYATLLLMKYHLYLGTVLQPDNPACSTVYYTVFFFSTPLVLFLVPTVTPHLRNSALPPTHLKCNYFMSFSSNYEGKLW